MGDSVTKAAAWTSKAFLPRCINEMWQARRFAELCEEKALAWAKKPVASEPAGEPNTEGVSSPQQKPMSVSEYLNGVWGDDEPADEQGVKRV